MCLCTKNKLSIRSGFQKLEDELDRADRHTDRRERTHYYIALEGGNKNRLHKSDVII